MSLRARVLLFLAGLFADAVWVPGRQQAIVGIVLYTVLILPALWARDDHPEDDRS